MTALLLLGFLNRRAKNLVIKRAASVGTSKVACLDVALAKAMCLLPLMKLSLIANWCY